MYLALYRSYRPETFGEVLGQEHIVKILKNQIRTDSTGHAYLFCGTRGTGKTTVARLLAKGVNCTGEETRPCGVCENCTAIRDGIFIDVIEIDAASNNGVDNIRELRESVKYPPAAGRKKVYIIDEVHMLSAGAFNALLKTLEEPPEYVMFILATTEPQKLPATVLSRCMRLDFRRVSEDLMKEAMAGICREKGIDVSEAALGLIAVNADGSVRDGLSILDQCIASGDLKITREDVLALIGAAGEEAFIEIADNIKNGRTEEALLIVDRAIAEGSDARQIIKDLLAHYRNLLIAKYINNPEDVLNLSSENAGRVKKQSEGMPLSDISRAIVEISKTAAEARWSTQPRILLELCLVMLSATPAAEKREAPPAAEPTLEKVKAAPATVPSPAAEKRETPPATVPAPEKTKEPATAAAPARGEATDGLWDSLFEGEDGLKGSFIMLRRAEIKSLTDKECLLAVQSGLMVDFVDKNKKTIEALMDKRTGSSRAVRCVIEKADDGGGGEKPIEALAAMAENILGLPVEIEE